MQKIGLGGAMFAISLAGLAALSFVYGNFAPAVDPLPWPKVVIYGLGALLLMASAGLLFARTAVASAITVAVYAVAWAVARSSPIFHQPLNVGSWYGSSEAMTTLVGAWTFYAPQRRRDGASAVTAITGDRALRVAQFLFGAACLVYGIAHFVYAAYTLPFVPTWLPARMPLVYLTGVGHTAAGIGLIVGVVPRLAAILEAIMITLFGLLVWLPTYFAHPVPKWAGSPQNQASEILVTFLLAAVAWMVAASLRGESRVRSSK